MSGLRACTSSSSSSEFWTRQIFPQLQVIIFTNKKYKNLWWKTTQNFSSSSWSVCINIQDIRRDARIARGHLVISLNPFLYVCVVLLFSLFWREYVTCITKNVYFFHVEQKWNIQKRRERQDSSIDYFVKGGDYFPFLFFCFFNELIHRLLEKKKENFLL